MIAIHHPPADGHIATRRYFIKKTYLTLIDHRFDFMKVLLQGGEITTIELFGLFRLFRGTIF